MDRKEWRLLQRVRQPPEGLNLLQWSAVVWAEQAWVEASMGKIGWNNGASLALTVFFQTASPAEARLRAR